MSKQPPPAPTASAIGPCPTVIQIVGCPGTGSLPRTIAPPDHPLWETARYRLKYCLKGPLNPKPTNQPTNDSNDKGQYSNKRARERERENADTTK